MTSASADSTYRWPLPLPVSEVRTPHLASRPCLKITEGFGYREAGPHLMLMAFLQRVVNGGGRIEREYGLGRRALDLMILAGLAEGVLVMFDLRREVSWHDKVTVRDVTHAGKQIRIFGC